MRPVMLWTDQEKFVARVEVPPFSDEEMPFVILWGSRVFLLHRLNGDDAAYREVFAWVSLTPSPGLDIGP